MEFRRTRRDSMREAFAQLAFGQKPDCLFIACCDSRVVPNVFASTDPGDLFVVRNIGNIMPAAPDSGSTVAALEFALATLKVRHIVICGHSDCGAMMALSQGKGAGGDAPLDYWLRHARCAAEQPYADLDSLSKRNVSCQLDNLRTHAQVKEMESAGEIKLHGLWFNIRLAEVSYLEKTPEGFTPIDEREGERILGYIGD